MKHKLLLLAAAGVATAVIARRRQNRLVAPMVPEEWRIDPDDYFDNDPINTRNAGARLDADDDTPDLTREALGLVRMIDEQEIEAAEQALARPDLDPALAEFADTVLAHHSESLAAAQALQIEPHTTAEVADFGERRGARLDELGDLDGEEYADAFLQAMVDSHQEALAMLDRLLPEAVDEDVRGFLATARSHVARHLQRGRELLAQR
jgi:putative membrane protein